MRPTLLALSLFLPLLSVAAAPPIKKLKPGFIKVSHPDDLLEHECQALLDAKKMPEKEHKLLADFYRRYISYMDWFQYHPDLKPKEKKEIPIVREKIKTGHKEFIVAMNAIPSFKQAKWKKLHATMAQQASFFENKILNELSFLENWDPKILRKAGEPVDITEVGIEVKDGETWAQQNARIAALTEQVKKQPLELRNPAHLSCNLTLELFADDKKFETFVSTSEKYECAKMLGVNTGLADAELPTSCMEKFKARVAMKDDERMKKKLEYFYRHWENCHHLATERETISEQAINETRAKLHALVGSAVSDIECEDSCPVE
jgi:hypothetical protein